MSEEKSYSFHVEGMTCASCVRITERSLKKVEGIEYVSINLATEKGYVQGGEDLEWEDLERAVAKAGYQLNREPPSRDKVEENFRLSRRGFILSLAITIPLMVLMILSMAGGIKIPGFLWMELLGGGFVLFYGGRHTLKGAGIALIHGHTNMDTLVSLGSFSAWITAPLHLAGLPLHSFGTLSAMLIAFHLTGRYLEARLKRRAAGEIRALMDLQEASALVIQEEGTLQEVPADTVKPGALLRLRQGDKIPLDGVLRKGSLLVEESMITGEALPVSKEEGHEVTGGTLVHRGSGDMEVTRTGKDTFLSQMVQLIEEAQSSRVPIQALADRITLFFVPAVFVLALISGLSWFLFHEQLQGLLQAGAAVLPWVDPAMGPLSTGIFVFIAVLVIACPCALGLATPMALTAGSGQAARMGILIRSGEGIQTARSVTSLCLDKTGTLTEGHPRVVHSTIPQEALPLLAAMEEHSSHPLAQAVRDFAEEGSASQAPSPSIPRLSEVKEISGEGVQAHYRGPQRDSGETQIAKLHDTNLEEGTLFIGRPRDPEIYRESLETGIIIIEARLNDKVLGTLSLKDPIKTDAAAMVQTLKERGITPIMVTGDNETTAHHAAREVGIEEIHAGMRPDGKVALLRKLQKGGEITAMTGDGINDAAALKAADLGIALGSGTDLSLESADAVIVSSDLKRIPELFTLSQKIYSTIKMNLFWAFFYNALALPMAVSGLLHPAIAEVAMTFSSVNVILRSLRINKNKGDKR